jgi:ribose transport system substrate-binding protein
MEPVEDCETSPVVAPAPAMDAPAEACSAAAAQIAMIDKAVEDRVDAITISVKDPECVTPALNRAVDAGIPVLTFDSDAPDSKRLSYYGMDNRSAGRFAVRTLASLLGGSGKIAIQTEMSVDAKGEYQPSTSQNFRERAEGALLELAEHPGLTLVATIPCVGSNVMDGSCARAADALLESTPDLAGFVFLRGKLLRELDIAANAPLLTAKVQANALKSVTFDATDDSLSRLDAGYAQMAIAQRQFGWGYDVVNLAYDVVVHDRRLPEVFDSGWYSVCPSNLDEYAAMWEAHDFRGELTECENLGPK